MFPGIDDPNGVGEKNSTGTGDQVRLSISTTKARIILMVNSTDLDESGNM